MKDGGAVVVTGANGGIGSALVDRLTQIGFRVFGGVHSPEACEALRMKGNDLVVPIHLDVTDATSVADAAGRIAAEVGSIGIAGLVNMAGVIIEGPLELVPLTDFQRQFQVNVFGPFAVTQALLPLLRMAKGRIVNIGAATAQTTVPFFGPISASKAALASITDAMRMELKTFGIKVVLIEPGAIATTIFAKSGAAQEAALNTAPPERTLIYRPAIEAMRKVTAKSGADKISVVVEAVVAALTVRTPKPRVLIGKGASQLAFLRHLPIRIRDSLLMRSLGIKQPLEAAARSLISAGTAVPAPSLRSGSSDETDWQEKGRINVRSQR